MKAYTTIFHDENCSRPILNLTDDGIYVASWLNKDKEIIYAIWTKGSSTDPIKINSFEYPVVYDRFGEVILDADLDNLDASKIIYLTHAGNIKVKKV